MATDPLRTRQHLVSRGYQENFAEDHRLTVLDAESGQVIEASRPMKSNWRQENFLTVDAPTGPSDSLEREFAEVERRALNQIRQINTISISPAQKQALDLVAAIHLVRSLSYVSIQKRVSDAYFAQCVSDFIGDPQVLAAFTADRGRQPHPGELEAIIASQAKKLQADPQLVANSMRHGTASLPALLSRYRVQLVSVPPWMPGFILANQPILHARPQEERYGFASGLAVGDADLIMVPIRRRLLAFYTSRLQAHLTLRTERGLHVINATLCSNAVSEVACHPADARAVSRMIRNRDRYPASILTDGTLR